MSSSAWSKLRSGARTTFQYRRSILLGLSTTFLLSRYVSSKLDARRRDFVHPDTVLYWRIYNGSIVEERTSGSNLNMLLNSQSSAYADEAPRVLTLFEVIRTLHWIAGDPRITGIVADFSSSGVPRTPTPYNLGLAQLEEIADHLHQLKKDKEKIMGVGKFKTLAVSDSFASQLDYVFASCFDEVYCQPTGSIPLVGLGAVIPFYSRLLDWLGIKVLAEGRTKWKSMVSPYVLEELSEPQRENEEELLKDLNDNMCQLIARNRFKSENPVEALKRVENLACQGPYDASEAVQAGLIDGTSYKRFVLKKALDESKPSVPSIETSSTTANALPNAQRSLIEDPEEMKKTKERLYGFYHYARTMENLLHKSEDTMEVGSVYLMGTIGETGTDFGHESVIRGLREAANDKDIKAVVLRVDSGGGGVIESDAIWDAVRELKEKNKTVIASFANAAASGGYLSSCHADAILAQPSSITGSIGVASLRPTISRPFLDRLKLNVQTFFTGSKADSLLHELEGEELAKHRRHIDATYEDFKARVVEGREIPSDKIEELAGGRVLTGSRAFMLSATPELQAVYRQHRTGQQIDQQTLDSAFESLERAKEKEVIGVSNTGSEAVSNEGVVEGKVVEYSLPSAFSRNLGNIGKGLIDGIGGIYDAAEFAAELSIAKGLEATKAKHPDFTDAQLMAEAFPEYVPEMDDQGNATLRFDLRLKRFPVERTILQQIMAASRRGDSIDPGTIAFVNSFGLALATFLLSSASAMLRQQFVEVGLDQPLNQMSTSNRMRAQYQGSIKGL